MRTYNSEFSADHITTYHRTNKLKRCNSTRRTMIYVVRIAEPFIVRKLDNAFVSDFFTGVNGILKKYNIKLIGGDLTSSDKIVVSVTVFGNTKNRNVSSRSNAKEGYIVAVSGEFGSSAQGLYNLQNKKEEDYFSKIHKCPILNQTASDEAATKTNYPYAMMDSSDGLADCLFQISEKSNVTIEVYYDKIPKKTDDRDFVLYGGEDYSLVAAIHCEDFKNLKNFIEIGKCYKLSNDSVKIDNKVLEYKGYNHFE